MPVNCARSPAGLSASVRLSLPLLLCCLSCTAACTGGDPPSDNAGTGAPCCGGLGSCVPLGLVPANVAPRLEQADCQSALVCAPSAWVEDPSAVAPSCRALGDVEGRCLPRCLPDVATLADRLEQASCSAGNLCVPCFDPRSGQDTRACRLGGDQPQEPANVFARCCGDRGRCLPRDALSQSLTEADLARLGPDACSSAQPALCVPEPWLDPAGARIESCRAFGDFEGRCLPSCLPELAARADTLRQDGCDRGQLCVPCFDPLSGEDTRACSVRGDAPRERARVYGRCCEERGRCVPQEVLLQSIAAADTLLLDGDVCSAEAHALCVPERWLDGARATPSDRTAASSSQSDAASSGRTDNAARASSPTGAASARVERCRALGDLEGRCLPSCLPAVAEQAAQLAQTSCAAGDLCVPCFDPLSGAESGACRIGDDRPRERARTFDGCCGERGRCVPHDLLLQSVPDTDLERLGRERCRQRDSLCVPEPWLEPEGVRAETCRAFGSLEGRCLPSCLPEVAGRARELRQEDCDRGELCVPCFDPRTGEETDACRLGGDRPLEPPRGFEPCCGQGSAALGTCVPVALLSREQAASLPVDSCSDTAGTRCAPSELLSSDGRLASCASFASGFTFTPSASGLCVPECFVSPLLRSFVPQGSCAAPHRCVSCSSLGSSFPGCP